MYAWLLLYFFVVGIMVSKLTGKKIARIQKLNSYKVYE